MYIKRGVIFHSISRRGEIVGVVVLTREYGCTGNRRRYQERVHRVYIKRGGIIVYQKGGRGT